MRNDLRIASLLPSSTEIVAALGLKRNIVGITHECDFPEGIEEIPHLTMSRISHESMSSKEIDHAVRTMIDGHGSIYDLNGRLLEELRPDLILTQELCDVCAVNYETVEKAARIYASDAKVVSLEPNTISEIFANIETVGMICGVSGAAAEVIDSLSKRLESVKRKARTAKRRPRVFMLEWLDPPFAPGHWVPEQVEIAGGMCVMGSAGNPSVATTYEQISESNPEVMVLIPCGYYTHDILRQIGQTVFPEEWRGISAIKEGNIWALDATSYFSRPGPRVIDGIEILAKIIHPELFGKPAEAEAVNVPQNLIRFG